MGGEVRQSLPMLGGLLAPRIRSSQMKTCQGVEMYDASIMYTLVKQHQQERIDEAARSRALSAAKRRYRAEHARSRSRVDR